MIEAICRLFPPSPPIKPLTDAKDINKKYRYWRIRILYAMFAGYGVYYFTRGTLAIVMPELKKIGFDEVALGWIITLFQISYALSKFISGIIADRSNPRYLMAFGLMATGVANLLFGFSRVVPLFLLFWVLNGWFQGWGSAPCHRLLTHWYSRSERGRWWSLWNASHNAGAALLPLIAAPVITLYGWSSGMWVPGTIALLIGIFLAERLRDTPQSLGLPRIESYRNDNPDAVPEAVSEKQLSTREILFRRVLNNPYIWLLSIAFFFIQTTRWAISQWSYHYLVAARGFTNWEAAKSLFWFETGGFLGGLSAGWLSDVCFRGKRGPISVLFSLMLVPVVVLFSRVTQTPDSVTATQSLMALSGFFIFGPHMLAMIAAAEIAGKKAGATAVGFLGIVAYVGCSLTGGPLGHVIRDLGWPYFFKIIIFGSILSSLCFIPLINVGTRERATL